MSSFITFTCTRSLCRGIKNGTFCPHLPDEKRRQSPLPFAANVTSGGSVPRGLCRLLKREINTAAGPVVSSRNNGCDRVPSPRSFTSTDVKTAAGRDAHRRILPFIKPQGLTFVTTHVHIISDVRNLPPRPASDLPGSQS